MTALIWENGIGQWNCKCGYQASVHDANLSVRTRLGVHGKEYWVSGTCPVCKTGLTARVPQLVAEEIEYFCEHGELPEED